ncbi:hypothetical protein BC833DRAFT_578030 [Globomyces pollinis-pini]|nr:hypothetical protein BC833DRAFT_578030 [Globomyces pollinis-pini]KAJ2994810.1 hypothetical protein HDV02_001309 [Globomyces sp. JEL0801]
MIRTVSLPFRSLGVLFSTPSLWLTILIPVLVLLFLALLAFIALMIFAFKPQALAIKSVLPDSDILDTLAWIVAFLLVVLETGIVLLILSLGLQRSQDRVFDTILKSKCPYLFQSNNSASAMDLIPSKATLWNSFISIIVLILTLPINLIPVAGQGVYVLINGYRQGRVIHTRYFELKGWDKTTSDQFMNNNSADYLSFGIMKTLLEMIPVVNFLGLYVSAIAAALFAADLEEKMANSNHISVITLAP